MRPSRRAAASTLLLSALAALPSFGIDMSLPALDATGRSLGVGADRAGLTISLFMLGYALAPPVCGPLSDQVGRKPVVLGAVAVFALASLGCATSHELPGLLAWRLAEGMGAGVTTTLAMAINNDLSHGPEAELKLARIATVMLFVPMLAPAAGSVMLLLGGWRGIFFLLTGLGLVLGCVVGVGFAESLRPGGHSANPAALLHGYACAIRDPACVGYSLVNAAAFGMMFAYISGSPVLLIDWLGLSHAAYSLAYAASFVGIIAGVQLNVRLSGRGVRIDSRLPAGIALAIAASAAFLVAVLAGWRWAPGLTALLTLGMVGFGLIVPNAIAAAIQPLPDHAGSASAMSGFIQVLVQSAVSAVVSAFTAWGAGLAIGVPMTASAVLALVAYLGLARPGRIILASLPTNPH